MCLNNDESKTDMLDWNKYAFSMIYNDFLSLDYMCHNARSMAQLVMTEDNTQP